MPGAASLTAVQYLNATAPKDGTAVTMFDPGLITESFAAPQLFKVKLSDFHWIGTMRPASVTTVAPAKQVPASIPSAAPSAPPVALTVASPSPALEPATSTMSVADRLLKQANAARESGDTVNALARLQEAAQRDPKNAEVLAEMAMIYESIQNFDRSADTWKRVQEIGPSTGPLYELADMKLKTGVSAPPGSTTGSALDVGKPATALDASSVRSTTEAIPAGATLAISEVTASETPDPDALHAIWLISVLPIDWHQEGGALCRPTSGHFGN